MSELPAKTGDGFVRFFIRHERLFGIAGMVWLAISCASYARFIDLPNIPFVTDEMALYFSAAYNAVWWGFLRPAIERRKAALESEKAEMGSADDAKRLRLMADYNCHPLWWDGGGTVGNVAPASLGLSANLQGKLEEWAERYNATLNHENPPESGFSSEEDERRFEKDGEALQSAISEELGSGFLVRLQV